MKRLIPRGKSIVVWEFLCTDIEGIESVGAIGAVFEQVFFGLSKFLAGLVKCLRKRIETVFSQLNDNLLMIRRKCVSSAQAALED